MEVGFSNARFAELLHSSTALTRKYGAENAKAIRLRLNSLDSAANLQVMTQVSGHFEELRADRAGTFSLRLKHGYRLIFKPRDPDSARSTDGTLDWSLVRAVVVLEIVDYHD